jgi:diguanylate cyclase (GGDEF)-like protein
MNNLSVDIRTVILLLWMGNLISVSLFAIYSYDQRQRFPITFFFRARLLQTIAWILLWLRESIPELFSAEIGNMFLFTGWALEAFAILSLRQRRLRFDILYAAVMVLNIPLNIVIYQLESPNLKVAIASIVSLAIFILPSLILTFERNVSALQRVVGSLYLIFSMLTTLRALAAFTSSKVFSLMTPDRSQTVTFIALFWLMMFGALGYLLLYKEKADQELFLAATVDPLTGVLNRRSFFRNAEAAVFFAIRNKDSVGLLTIDIDKFKRINDVFGHPAGDLVLKDFAASTLQFVRPYDVFGRIGGDEFVVLLSNVSSAEALTIAERIQAKAGGLPASENPHVDYTVSIGVCSMIPQSVEDFMEMVQVSDEALLAAKNAGRNCVFLKEVADPK